MFFSKDFRRKAREVLRGRTMLAMAVGLVASLLGAYTAMQHTTIGSGNTNRSNHQKDLSTQLAEIGLPEEMIPTILSIVAAMGIVMVVCVIIGLIFSGAVSVGYARFNLNLVDNKTARFSDLFSQFDRFGTAFAMQFLRRLYILLWSLLLIIPGWIAMLSYAMAPYILSENPNMGVSEAIDASKKLMDGHKWNLFCLSLSFIGWDILGVLTGGIGFLWVNPYREATYAVFYRKIRNRQELDERYRNGGY